MKKINPFKSIGKPLKEVPEDLKEIVMDKIHTISAEAEKDCIVAKEDRFKASETVLNAK